MNGVQATSVVPRRLGVGMQEAAGGLRRRSAAFACGARTPRSSGGFLAEEGRFPAGGRSAGPADCSEVDALGNRRSPRHNARQRPEYPSGGSAAEACSTTLWHGHQMLVDSKLDDDRVNGAESAARCADLLIHIGPPAARQRSLSRSHQPSLRSSAISSTMASTSARSEVSCSAARSPTGVDCIMVISPLPPSATPCSRSAASASTGAGGGAM